VRKDVKPPIQVEALQSLRHRVQPHSSNGPRSIGGVEISSHRPSAQ
jgi:hypothetical protein